MSLLSPVIMVVLVVTIDTVPQHLLFCSMFTLGVGLLYPPPTVVVFPNYSIPSSHYSRPLRLRGPAGEGCQQCHLERCRLRPVDPGLLRAVAVIGTDVKSDRNPTLIDRTLLLCHSLYSPCTLSPLFLLLLYPLPPPLFCDH